MHRALRWIRPFHRDESGPTSSEYAVMLAFILMVVIAAVMAVGNSTSSIWKDDANQVEKALGS